MLKAQPTSIYAVVVTFFPEEAPLRKLLTALASQTDAVIVVDNTVADDGRVAAIFSEIDNVKTHLIRLGVNQGIARALNIGIETAIEAGATHVLLSDQDSLPASNMVAELLTAEADILAAGKHPAAVGPTFTDRHTGITFPFQACVPGKFFYGHQRPGAAHPVVEALSLITSGTLIRTPVLHNIGPMREDFFIDDVDVEWCHRARAAGYELYGIGSAIMYHSLGDDVLRVWYFGWRKESSYPPSRVYYGIRNFIAMCRMPIIGIRWKVRNGWYYLGFVYAQVIFGHHRIQALRMALRGLYDGLRNHMGPL